MITVVNAPDLADVKADAATQLAVAQLRGLSDLGDVHNGEEPLGKADGHLRGVQIQPRVLAQLAYDAGFKDAKNLFIAVAVALAESQGYDRAYNDNISDTSGDVLSRDVGVWEINIPASQIGTARETDLYDPEYNARAAYGIYKAGGWRRWASVTSEVYLRPYYSGRASLGVMNYCAEEFVQLGAPLPVPIFTLAELHARLKW